MRIALILWLKSLIKVFILYIYFLLLLICVILNDMDISHLAVNEISIALKTKN